MGLCGDCHHNVLQAPVDGTLLQIREGYRVQWRDLTFSVETDSNHWTLRVQDSKIETIYLAHRSGAKAAQVAAAEFGIFRVLGAGSPMSPDVLAKELPWQRYW